MNEHELIESYEIYKRYPSDLNINVIKAKFLANISIDNQLYFIGSNQKFIKSKKLIKHYLQFLENQLQKSFL